MDSPSSFCCNDLEMIVALFDQDRLKQSGDLNRLGELLQLGYVKIHSGLIRIGSDLVDWRFSNPLGLKLSQRTDQSSNTSPGIRPKSR